VRSRASERVSATVDEDDIEVTITRDGFFSRDLSTFRCIGFWRTRTEAMFASQLERPVQIFLICVVLLLWRRAAAAAS
jgi:hypothetical protein